MTLYIEGVIGTQPFVKERSLPDPRESAPRQSESTRSAGEVSLAEACAGGEIGAFEQLYHLHGARMKSLAWNLLGNETDAEDAVLRLTNSNGIVEILKGGARVTTTPAKKG